MENVHALEANWKSFPHHYTTSFNAKLNTVPFNWIKNGEKSEMHFFGGLFGVKYDLFDKNLLPVFGYGVYQK